jgi:hypothetical protein
MKKLAIGCLIVLVLAGAVIAGVSYYAYRQARAMFAQFAELGQVPEIEQRVRNKSAFVPPASEELTARQVERLVQVQARVRKRLGERFAELESRYKVLSEKQNPTIVDAPMLLSAYRDLAAGWVDAKRSQVEALNEADLSLQEYRWIRNQAYKALGVPFMDFDVAKLVEEIRAGGHAVEPGRISGAIGPSGPESNRKLIEAYRKQLEENLALAAFGL